MSLTNASFSKIVSNLHDGLYLVDKHRVITFWNHAAEQISGYTADEVVGRACSDNILTHVDNEGNKLCNGMCPLAATMCDGKFRESEIYMHHKNGHRIPVSVRVSTLTDDLGNIIGGIELFTDISNRKSNDLRVKELEKLAMLDNLTQLANRNYIEKEIENRFQEYERFDMPFGILFMDIDHFKQFNDTFGHDVGDEVLKFVSDTFVSIARPFDLFGRWGGEEFIGIIRNIEAKDLGKFAERVRLLIEEAYITRGDKRLNVTISIGATVMQTGDTMETLIKRADKHLYQSKAAGRNRVTLG